MSDIFRGMTAELLVSSRGITAEFWFYYRRNTAKIVAMPFRGTTELFSRRSLAYHHAK